MESKIENTIKRISLDLKCNSTTSVSSEEWELLKKFMCSENIHKVATQYFCIDHDIEHIHEENAFPYGDTYDYYKCRKCNKIISGKVK